MSKTLKIDIDDDVLLGLNISADEMALELRIAAAIKMYEVGRISQGKAAQIAGLSRAEFITALSKFKISPVQEEEAELLETIRE
ncbi:UPF0175 family protein [bacterium]|nr:UPF0175 family protein [bacterium]